MNTQAANKKTGKQSTQGQFAEMKINQTRKQIRQRLTLSENTPNKSKISKQAQSKSNPKKIVTPDFKIYAQSVLISIPTFVGIWAVAINFVTSALKNG